MIVSLKLTAILRWFFWEVLNERERRGLNHVLIWFAEVTCLSDSAPLLSFKEFSAPRVRQALQGASLKTKQTNNQSKKQALG